MAHPSDPEFLVLHSLRLKGFADVDALCELARLPQPDVAAHLDKLNAAGHVHFREGRLTGWSLTPEGRQRHAAACAAEVEASGTRPVIASAYEDFKQINQPFLAVCTQWQLREKDGAQIVNDHLDEEYDRSVVGRLGELHRSIVPICGRLAGAVARFEGYEPRLRTALDRVESGQHVWFTGALIESYHTVWFELHEDLLATLGIARDKETLP